MPSNPSLIRTSRDHGVALVGGMGVVLGQEVARRPEAVASVDRVVDVCAAEPLGLGGRAEHPVPGVEDHLRLREHALRHAGVADPVVVPVDRPQQGRLARAKSRQVVEQLDVLRPVRGHGTIRAAAVDAPPVGHLVGVEGATAGRVLVQQRGVVRDPDQEHVCLLELGVERVQLGQQHRERESVVLRVVVDLHLATGRGLQRARVTVDEPCASRTVLGAVVRDRVADHGQVEGPRSRRRRRTSGPAGADRADEGERDDCRDEGVLESNHSDHPSGRRVLPRVCAGAEEASTR